MMLEAVQRYSPDALELMLKMLRVPPTETECAGRGEPSTLDQVMLVEGGEACSVHCRVMSSPGGTETLLGVTVTSGGPEMGIAVHECDIYSSGTSE